MINSKNKNILIIINVVLVIIIGVILFFLLSNQLDNLLRCDSCNKVLQDEFYLGLTQGQHCIDCGPLYTFAGRYDSTPIDQTMIFVTCASYIATGIAIIAFANVFVLYNFKKKEEQNK